MNKTNDPKLYKQIQNRMYPDPRKATQAIYDLFSQELQKAREEERVKVFEELKNDLEIINEHVGEGIEVGVLGSKGMMSYIDTQENLLKYLSLSHQSKEEK